MEEKPPTSRSQDVLFNSSSQHTIENKQFTNDWRYFMDDRIAAPKLTADNEVEPATLAMMADYQLITPPEDFSLLLTLARRFEGKTLGFFNYTGQGGGSPLVDQSL